MIFTSKLQANGLANIPSVVQKALGLEKGDNIVFEVLTKRNKTIVTVKKEERGE